MSIRIKQNGKWVELKMVQKVDPSLSTEGAAADAKAVGDRLDVLEDMIDGSGGTITSETDPIFTKWRDSAQPEDIGALSSSGGTVTGQLNLEGYLVLKEGVHYGTEAQRPTNVPDGTIFFREVTE